MVHKMDSSGAALSQRLQRFYRGEEHGTEDVQPK
jgi:hypothetical protein